VGIQTLPAVFTGNSQSEVALGVPAVTSCPIQGTISRREQGRWDGASSLADWLLPSHLSGGPTGWAA